MMLVAFSLFPPLSSRHPHIGFPIEPRHCCGECQMQISFRLASAKEVKSHVSISSSPFCDRNSQRFNCARCTKCIYVNWHWENDDIVHAMQMTFQESHFELETSKVYFQKVTEESSQISNELRTFMEHNKKQKKTTTMSPKEKKKHVSKYAYNDIMWMCGEHPLNILVKKNPKIHIRLASNATRT